MFPFIPKATTINVTLTRGRRGFGENMKHGFRALKNECANFFCK